MRIDSLDHLVLTVKDILSFSETNGLREWPVRRLLDDIENGQLITTYNLDRARRSIDAIFRSVINKYGKLHFSRSAACLTHPLACVLMSYIFYFSSGNSLQQCLLCR
jgi:hypothetical protein